MTTPTPTTPHLSAVPTPPYDWKDDEVKVTSTFKARFIGSWGSIKARVLSDQTRSTSKDLPR